MPTLPLTVRKTFVVLALLTQIPGCTTHSFLSSLVLAHHLAPTRNSCKMHLIPHHLQMRLSHAVHTAYPIYQTPTAATDSLQNALRIFPETSCLPAYFVSLGSMPLVRHIGIFLPNIPTRRTDLTSVIWPMTFYSHKPPLFYCHIITAPFFLANTFPIPLGHAQLSTTLCG